VDYGGCVTAEPQPIGLSTMMRTRLLWATRRAASLGLSAALGVTLAGPVFAQTVFAQATAPAPKAAPSAPEAPAAESGGEQESGDPAERLAKRRERLEQGAKRLRERAEQLRAQVGKPPTDPKHIVRDPVAQAQKLDDQAKKMEERAQNLTLDDVKERSPEAARENRHKMRRAHINRRWGAPTLHDPEAMAELRVHAERVAKLKRIQFIARAKSKDDPAIARVKVLLNKEDDRYEQHMKAIQARVAPPAAPAAGTTVTTAPETK
jgi:hypothetical protein